ncbi:MAG: TlpA family protein disulfide reductase [Rhodospirillales bacterium]|nr:TlpA family protein disulfide reductase [Rhodospirillales bacterium]
MACVTRRSLLLASVLAGGTLAAGLIARKPRAAAPLAALRVLDPPLPAPDLVFHDGAGKPVTLAAYRGRGVVLNLWATWCAPCVAEMPALDTLATALAGSRIAVLAVSTDLGGADVVRRFYAAHHITALPLLLDPDSTAATALKVEGVPATFLIDPEGRIRGFVQGAQDWAAPSAIARVKTLLGGG